MNGFLCVLKPPGMTSSDVVVRVRRKLGGRIKVGHAGTLDPEAAGVLPIMTGKASRLFDYLVEKEKVYIAQLIPGYATDTQDTHGQIISGEGKGASREELEAVLPRFTGEIGQIPPAFSALKRDGQKLCDLARRGMSVEMEPRPVHIDEIRVTHALEDGSYLIRVRCGRGTYIRTLCHDIGKAMGCQAHMGFLLRTQTGVFTLEDAHTIEEIDESETLSPLLMAMDRPLAHLPAVTVTPDAERFVRNGNALRARQIHPVPPHGERVRLYMGDRFAGIGHMCGEEMKFDAMLLE